MIKVLKNCILYFKPGVRNGKIGLDVFIYSKLVFQVAEHAL